MSQNSKTHTTNYTNTFIQVAEDTNAVAGVKPMLKNDRKTVAEMKYDLMANNPYSYTSDDILFQVYADKNALLENEYPQARAQFFSKGQPCFRASTLTKTYGFGIHANADGKEALYGVTIGFDVLHR